MTQIVRFPSLKNYFKITVYICFTGITGSESVCWDLGLPGRYLRAIPGGAVFHFRRSHIRVPPQIRAGRRRNLSVAPPINLRSGDHLGLRAALVLRFAWGSKDSSESNRFFLRREQHGCACGGVWEPEPGATGCAHPDCRGEGWARGARKGGTRSQEALPGGLRRQRGAGRGFRACSGLGVLVLRADHRVREEGPSPEEVAPAVRGSIPAHCPRLGPLPVFVSVRGGFVRTPALGDVPHFCGLIEDT